MIIQVQDKDVRYESPHVVHEVLQAQLQQEDLEDREKEHFWVLMLDTRNRIRAFDLISLGTIGSSLVHPREVFRRAVIQGTSAIILAHNHPSGVSEPSEGDMKVTENLVQAGKILGIEVLDHVITSSTGFYSFKQAGLI